MTANEIFAKINNHMLEGIMLHDQLASYYDFLNLPGYIFSAGIILEVPEIETRVTIDDLPPWKRASG